MGGSSSVQSGPSEQEHAELKDKYERAQQELEKKAAAERERIAPKKLAKPWREDLKFNDKEFLEALRREVIEYFPLKGQGAKKGDIACTNILLLGPMKSGKSTLINSLYSVFKGYVAMTVPTGERDRSLTKKLKRYAFDSGGKELKFKIYDSRGLEKQYNPSKELGFLLDGHMQDGYEFNIDIPFTEMSKGYKKSPQLHDKVHCVVYIVDAAQVTVDGDLLYPDYFKAELAAIQKVIDARGIPQLLVMSKVDTVCSYTNENVSDLLYSEHNFKRCRHLEKILAIPIHGILPSRNYKTEHSLDDNTTALALYNVRQMLRAGDDYLAQQARDKGKCFTH